MHFSMDARHCLAEVLVLDCVQSVRSPTQFMTSDAWLNRYGISMFVKSRSLRWSIYHLFLDYFFLYTISSLHVHAFIPLIYFIRNVHFCPPTNHTIWLLARSSWKTKLVIVCHDCICSLLIVLSNRITADEFPPAFRLRVSLSFFFPFSFCRLPTLKSFFADFVVPFCRFVVVSTALQTPIWPNSTN